MRTPIRVVELFAGVGGFHIGLRNASPSAFKVVWSNQWEPAAKEQVASRIYRLRFPDTPHVNEDIEKVPTADIPEHDLLVAGFPCQDYSVAKPLNQAEGIQGKKGVLWWSIHRILRELPRRPSLLLFENVDRLLKSPGRQRGRDFAVMLASLADLGYAVEWRVINAADYGMPQRRRRVFFLCCLSGTPFSRSMERAAPLEWITARGVLGKAFPAEPQTLFPTRFHIHGRLHEVSERFNEEGGPSPFLDAGLMLGREVHTIATRPVYEGPRITLGDIIEKDESRIPREFFISGKELPAWRYLKGAKKEPRVNRKTGHSYLYSEGAVPFPDPLDRPARTIITSEGGPQPSRFKHVIRTDSGRYRRLTPVELERLNMFPDNHTEGATDRQRAFLMGNALVTGIVTRIAVSLLKNLGIRVRPTKTAGNAGETGPTGNGIERMTVRPSACGTA